jgi:2,3-bisphosphoglycerate-independent phosphoglycerate mutase
MADWKLGLGRFPAVRGPVLVVVMDGVGIGPDDQGNAVRLARTPRLDDLYARSGCVPLAAHGTAVGLPSDADMGNSEVGHNALGSGRVVSQGASLVNDAIESGRLFDGETWRWLVEGAKQSGEPMHFIGLLSDGNVHSHDTHLHAMLRRACKEGVKKARIHALLDGRDVGETSAPEYVDRLEKVLAELNAQGCDYRVASGGGRMKLTMDRYEADWGMVEVGWKHHVLAEGRHFASAHEAIEALREDEHGLVTDQFLPGFVIADEKGPVGPIRDGASVVLFNFRGDRALEITRAFERDDVPFERTRRPKVRYAGMMKYDHEADLPQRYLVDPPVIQRTMGEYLARNGVSQFACSETQKFGHVTYFWNGNRSGRFDDALETYVEVPSDRVPFEQRPWMKSAEIADATLEALRTGKYRFARVNFANGDMVGHTGKLLPTILSMEAMDLAIGRLLDGIAKMNGVLLVTADHGNAEEMFEHDKHGAVLTSKEGKPKVRTSHSLFPVPLSLFDPAGQVPARLAKTVERPGLANVAATCLELLGFAPPADYEPSLLQPK